MVYKYGLAVRLLSEHLMGIGHSTPVDAITREDIEGFLEATLARAKPATAATRYQALRQLFK